MLDIFSRMKIVMTQTLFSMSEERVQEEGKEGVEEAVEEGKHKSILKELKTQKF